MNGMKSRVDGRRTYDSWDPIRNATRNSTRNARIGYCGKDHRWILYDTGSSNDIQPCDAKDKDMELAHSSKTNDFDIGESFEEQWFVESTPIKVIRVNETEKDIDKLKCDMTIGNGICDLPFNNAVYQYDNGDCCAASCEHPDCLLPRKIDAFGNADVFGIGFPDCKDKRMKPINIRLHEIKSSHDETFSDFTPCLIEPQVEDAWRTMEPKDTMMSLSCDEKLVLVINIDKSMENKTQTVLVTDEAKCKLRFITSANEYESAAKLAKSNLLCSDPIWYADYTIFHEITSDTEMEQVKILSQNSSEKAAFFQRIPECFFDKLRNFVDILSIYNRSTPLNKAINWLLSGNITRLSECKNKFFLERFALSFTKFAMAGSDGLIQYGYHCYWPWARCNIGGHVNEIHLINASLQGGIPSQLTLLSKLENIYLRKLIVVVTYTKKKSFEVLGGDDNKL
jgi:hypothetical protein